MALPPFLPLSAAETESEKEIGLAVSAPSDTVIGQSFAVLVTVRNKTSQSHSYRMTLKGRAMLYTGIPGQLVTSARETITIGPRKCEEGGTEGGGGRE